MKTIVSATMFLASLALLGATARADNLSGQADMRSVAPAREPPPPRGAAITPFERNLDRGLPPGPESPVATLPPGTPAAAPVPPAPTVVTLPTLAPPTPATLLPPSIPTVPSTGTPVVNIPIAIPSFHF